jgi:AraC family transcriptional regulator
MTKNATLAIMKFADIDTGVADYPRASAYGPRELTDWELVWVITGSARWSRVNDAIALATGDLILIPPGAPDRLEWSRKRGTRHGWIHFRVLSPRSELGRGQPARMHRMTNQDPAAQLCRYALSLGRSADARLAGAVSLLVEIMLAPAQSCPGAAQRPSEVLMAAATAAGKHYRRFGPGRIGLDELADAAGISRRQLSRVVYAELGVGPGRAFESVRLARVAHLLARSDLTVKAIADACGYESPFHLSRRFRACYGCPPTTYRNLAGPDQHDQDPFLGTPIETLITMVAAAEGR